MRAVTVTECGATPAVAAISTPEPGPGQLLIKLGGRRDDPDEWGPRRRQLLEANAGNFSESGAAQ